MNKKANILIVDDLPENLLILEDLLCDYYTIFTAVDGVQALEILQQHPTIDLILMDVMMPVMDGFEACQKIKSSAQHKDTPLLFITSLDSTDDETYALSLGAEDFIQKPFSPPVVMARIRNHLQLSHTKQLLKTRNDILVREASERSARMLEESEHLLREHQKMVDVQLAAMSAVCVLNLKDSNNDTQYIQAQNYICQLAALLSGQSQSSRISVDEALRILQTATRSQYEKEIVDAMLAFELPLDAISEA